LIDNEVLGRVYRLNRPDPSFADAHEVLRKISNWDVPWGESRDISNAVLFLSFDMSRHVTGVSLPVDLGMVEKYSGS
jgi:(-)-trans-carveol dehydrogenase